MRMLQQQLACAGNAQGLAPLLLRSIFGYPSTALTRKMLRLPSYAAYGFCPGVNMIQADIQGHV